MQGAQIPRFCSEGNSRLPPVKWKQSHEYLMWLQTWHQPQLLTPGAHQPIQGGLK